MRDITLFWVLGILLACIGIVGCVGIVDGEAPRSLTEGSDSEGVTESSESEGLGAGSQSGPKPTNSGFATVQSVIEDNCAGCHNDDSLGVDFGGAALHDVLTTHTVSACGGNVLVVPGDVAGSAIVGLVTGTCSMKMPPSCKNTPCVTEAEVENLKQWIELGAPSD